MSSPDSPPPEPNPPQKNTPLRCLVGSGISGGLAWALHLLTSSIAITFATKPITSEKIFVIKIASAVRTLVLGLASLGTFVFVFVAIGLVLLAGQLLWQQWFTPSNTAQND